MTREEAIEIVNFWMSNKNLTMEEVELEALQLLLEPPRWLKLSENPLLPEHVGQACWTYGRGALEVILTKIFINKRGQISFEGFEDRATHYCLLGYPPKFEGEK